MRVARAATGKLGFISFHNDYHGRTGGSASVTSSRSSNAPRDPGTYLVPSGHAYRCGFCQDYDGCQLRCADFVGQSLAQNLPGPAGGRGDRAGHQRQRRHHLPPGVRPAGGRHRAGRRRAVHRRRDRHRLRPDGRLVRQHRRGRRARRDGAGQGHGQRLPGHRHRRARRAGRVARRLVPEHELRRQPHGLRRGRRGDQGDAGGRPRRPLPPDGRAGPGPDAGDGRRATRSSARPEGAARCWPSSSSRTRRPASRSTRPATSSTRRPSARAWPGRRPATSCASRHRS